MRDVHENGVLQNEANISFGFNGEVGFVRSFSADCRAACAFSRQSKQGSELGRIGGKRNGHAALADGDPLPSVYTASTVQDTIARLLNDLHSGKIHPNVATPMATLLNLQLRAIEATDHERKITDCNGS
jgi:hypothetical protein